MPTGISAYHSIFGDKDKQKNWKFKTSSCFFVCGSCYFSALQSKPFSILELIADTSQNEALFTEAYFCKAAELFAELHTD